MTTTHQPSPRAARFSMNLPVRYRMEGDEGWSYGMTVNVSSTGVLFRSGRVLDPHAAMHIEVVLPGDEHGSARVISRGAVTRSMTDEGGDDHVIAAALDRTDLVRTDR